ncbi:MAG: hypothetical protein AAGA09_03475 [Pseudomonadota bacterium]
MGNGLANIVAAAIVALAIVYTGGFGGQDGDAPAAVDDNEKYAEWYARAVGDIRNDIVVNCGCCGDEGPRRAASNSF